MPIIKKCKVCKNSFRTKLFFVKNGGGIYCSKICHYKGLRKGKMIKCFICGNETYKSPKAFKNSKSGKLFCSKSCQTKWRNSEFVGEKHANWVDGKFSYRSVLKRHKVPQVCKFCENGDKRVLAVHHIDGNRINNKLENLTWLCHNCHHLVHHDKVEQRKFMAIVV